MNEQAEKPYRELDEVELVELQQLMQLLQDVRVAPKDLLAFALALDTIECHKENAEEGPDGALSLEDTLSVNHEVEVDDGDMVDDLYRSARTCLVKMGKLEATA